MYYVADAVFWRNLVKDAVVAVILTALIYAVLRRTRTQPKQIAAKLRRPVLIVLAAAILPIGWRLAILPWRLIPEPTVHDEFAHLLVADTLAAGRLANPSHPLWRHFDTFYVLQHPTYASVYPIGEGLILAVGKILTGNAWFGIVIATALMSAAIAWALLGILPPGWVAIGILPIVFTYGYQWIDAYWGGTFCAFGGALLFGALFRLRKRPSVSVAMVGAVGWSIVWLTRPFESMLLLLVFGGAMVWFVVRSESNRKQWVRPIAGLLLVLAGTGTLTLAHNHAVTGSFTTIPYRLDQKLDGVPQSFIWQPPIPPPKYRFPEMQDMYIWQLEQKQLSAGGRLGTTLHRMWSFFVTPWFSLPLVFAVFAIGDRSVRWAWSLIVCATALTIVYPFFFVHYIAAYSCIFAFLIIQGWMKMAVWSPGGRRFGRWLALFLVFGGLFSQPTLITSFKDMAHGFAHRTAHTREYISEQLKSMGGKHVVFVRYGEHHDFHNEWVYNAADIDRATVVWCRWLGPREDSEVMRYYPKRQFWIAEVNGEDTVAAKFYRYDVKQAQVESASR